MRQNDENGWGHLFSPNALKLAMAFKEGHRHAAPRTWAAVYWKARELFPGTFDEHHLRTTFLSAGGHERTPTTDRDRKILAAAWEAVAERADRNKA